jgi:hypothetical protein
LGALFAVVVVVVVAEFTFPKPYAMDEFESQRFLDALRQHAQLAHARHYAYFLPLLESLQDVVVVDNKVDATSVQLTVRNLCPF